MIPNTILLMWIDRVVGFLLIVVLLPTVLLAGLLIHVTSGAPVMLLDEVVTRGGAISRAYRLRTTGTGTPAFGSLSRLLRKFAIDVHPAFWSVARGDIRLRDVFDLIDRREK